MQTNTSQVLDRSYYKAQEMAASGWQRWFAWYPVTTPNHRSHMAWMEYCWRRRGANGRYEYYRDDDRELPEDIFGPD